MCIGKVLSDNILIKRLQAQLKLKEVDSRQGRVLLEAVKHTDAVPPTCGGLV